MRTIIAVDVGSLPRGSFAWAAARDDLSDPKCDDSFPGLVDYVAESLELGGVALGLEGPLFLPDDPQTDAPESLTRLVDDVPGGQVLPWNIGAGAYSLVAAMTQLFRLCRALTEASPTGIRDYGTSIDMRDRPGTLQVWEAFVSGDAKRFKDDHLGDAINAVVSSVERGSDVEVVTGSDTIGLREPRREVGLINVPRLVLDAALNGAGGLFDSFEIIKPLTRRSEEHYRRFGA